ncbi:transposable element gene [Prunus dulcis]|uniref:Transposable element protein n=1 Tax=Prunus dulcis TaxID=3755 RepID=A0A4Y1R5D3_PRUDU|nr:transposable element gene [Prunus dulcis]
MASGQSGAQNHGQGYLKGTIDYGLLFSPGSLTLKAYTDADWAGSNPISWASKKQHAVSRSSTEAKYRAMATTAAELSWLQQLLRDVHFPMSSPPLLLCHNLSTMALSINPVLHSSVKHIEVDCHFVCKEVTSGQLNLQHVSSSLQVANILPRASALLPLIFTAAISSLGHPNLILLGDDSENSTCMGHYSK